MPRYIDADNLLSLFYVASAGQDKEFAKTVEMVVDDTPTIDAVEVVRCKDCKHWIVDSYWNGNPDKIRACRFAGWIIGANGYCVHGEKMDMEVSNHE